MTSPIKPPGGKPGVDQSTPVDQSERTGRSEAFREALEAQPAARAKGSESPNVVSEIVADLRAGRIDRVAAMDRLIAEELRGPFAEALTPAGRVELEAHLRAALEDDPALQQLIEDAER